MLKLVAIQGAEILSLNLIPKLKNYISYNAYLKKQELVKENLENRIRNTLDDLREIKNNSNREKIANYEFELYKLLEKEVKIENKSNLEKLKVSKKAVNSICKIENNYSSLENFVSDLKNKEKITNKDVIDIGKHICSLNTNLYSTNSEENYLNLLYSKLKENPSPINIDGSIAKGKSKIKKKEVLIYHRDKINLKCSPLDLKDDSNKFNLECYFSKYIPEDTKNFVTNFKNNNKIIFTYSLSESKLYSSIHPQSEAFSNYFDPKKEPLQVEEILRMEARKCTIG